ncbi:hypothetical protein [Pyrobaculum islandicum]|nr:hypothetical protein [Pyrobaculum islandicum]
MAVGLELKDAERDLKSLVVRVWQSCHIKISKVDGVASMPRLCQNRN